MPYIALFDPKKRDIEESSLHHKGLYCPFHPKKGRYRPDFRGYFQAICYHYNMLAWPDPRPY